MFGSNIERNETSLRFLAGHAFEPIEAKYDISHVIVGTDRSSNMTSLEDELAGGRRKVVWIPFYPERYRRWEMMFDVSCVLHADRSSSFAVRNQEGARTAPAYYARLKKLARQEVYDRHRKAVEEKMGLNPAMLALTLRERPDFFILPSAALDHVTDDVLQIAEALAIPTLLLVAGWDNLSSKGLLYHKPTMVGVWGEQSRKHAVEVQGIEEGRVFSIGAPHYEVFRDSKQMDRDTIRQTWGVPLKGNLILFAGTLRLFDETRLLEEIDQAIDLGLLPSMHFVYRPHPLRSTRAHESNFFDHEWHHITMDPQVADAYRTRTQDNFLSRMNQLARLYCAVDAVVSPMSTVLLEALMFGLPTMAVAFGDGKHSWSADKVSGMLHFKELYEVHELLVCRDRANFFSLLRELVSKIGDSSWSAALRGSTGYFVCQDEQSYGNRVLSLVETMMSRVKEPPRYDLTRVKPGKTFAVRNWWIRSALRKYWKSVARRLAR